jgi:hypothetical protein
MATVAALVSLSSLAPNSPAAANRRSAPLIFLSIAVAVVFAGAALRYDEFDAGLHRVAAAMKGGHIDDAMVLYKTNGVWTPLDQTADLWFSRTLVAALPQAEDMMLRRRAWELAIQTAERATAASEERANAYYHLAALRAFNDELPKTEQSIRMAIAFAPKWYKPHLLLARILAETGRPQEAAEQRLLADRFGGKAAAAMDTDIPTTTLKPDSSTSHSQGSRP